ncbi:MAG: F0F1 ATP synthase subunit epsilon [Thermomicrobiales bacterium]|jgi:F-type H+-transporting ATPase subunit epsilon|nr:F0F1 ATP synthase subunit epsilon [Thermomicrobiales bacterium]
MAKLTVEVVTGERIVFTDDEVDMVIAPGASGTLGILPNHAPLITTLAGGELRVKKSGQEYAMVVFGGFMEVTPDKVIILADAAERVEEIDASRAEAARKRAEDEISKRGATEDLAAAQASLRRANIRLRTAERRRGGRRSELPGT